MPLLGVSSWADHHRNPSTLKWFYGYQISPRKALPQGIAGPHIGWLFKNRGRTGLLPGGVIKIKFHSSKHSGTQSIISICGHGEFFMWISQKYSDLRKTPPAKSTPGGERNLNVPQTQAFQPLGGGYSYTVNCAEWLFHLSGKGHAPTMEQWRNNWLSSSV